MSEVGRFIATSNAWFNQKVTSAARGNGEFSSLIRVTTDYSSRSRDRNSRAWRAGILITSARKYGARSFIAS